MSAKKNTEAPHPTTGLEVPSLRQEPKKETDTHRQRRMIKTVEEKNRKEKKQPKED